jgi:hypothetical protein
MDTRPVLVLLPRRHPVGTAVTPATAVFAACLIAGAGGELLTSTVSNTATLLMALAAGAA